MTCSAEAIAAVVVTYRSAASIDACLARLRAAQAVVQIRVVDNGSDDGTLEIVQRHAARDGRVHFIANPDNPGFATACNQGAADSDAPWLAFVNPDLMVEADSLARLREHAVVLGGAVLGADLVDADGVRDAAARRRDPDFAAMLRHPGAAARLGVPMQPQLAVQPVEAVSGALVLLPRILFEQLHGWDAGYRLHAEDLDLCRRARQAGATVAVVNDVRVVHWRGISSRSRPLFVEWHKHRGLWRYFRKFEAPRRSAPVRLAVRALIGAHFLAVALRIAVGRV
ncbi:MAG: glycosyltransferase family 2 protein [Pseudoxanthomonas sp.]